ncbi:PREDICTED: probable F-box protein At5g04010 [Ipomoea nil]|uniref:probable F-box protein At5g04010 n=1 Tax=Ipomoea nil TaxID=35883 RepID=UPI0009018353|nr:PREDICTED: probable F-box protein At5g04010 [Ipomoea nil]
MESFRGMMAAIPAKRTPPQWQVIALVANHLDPKSLAVASCVCKLWFISMSSDHLWRSICTARFPSLSTLRLADPGVPYRRLYALGRASETRRLRKRPPPLLSMSSIIFAVNVFHKGSSLITVVKPGSELDVDRNGVFRFDVDVAVAGGGGGSLAGMQELRDVRVTWDVVLEGYQCKFTMLDCEGKGNLVSGLEAWYSEELPAPGCCSASNDAVSGLVSDLRLGLKERCGRIVVANMSLGLLNIVSWRYVLVVDTLRYLQHFLLP